MGMGMVLCNWSPEVSVDIWKKYKSKSISCGLGLTSISSLIFVSDKIFVWRQACKNSWDVICAHTGLLLH